jgi:hypothetical protein
VECIANLDLNLNLYLAELSRVLFKKENMKTKEGYWLSAFYSFCIQSTVRKALCKMARDDCWENGTPTLNQFLDLQLSASDQFLHVAVRLFIASSGTYDPLNTDYSTIATESLSTYEKDLILLQKTRRVAVQDSAEYLKGIFEIEEVAPAAPPDHPWNISAGIPTDRYYSPIPPHSASVGPLPSLAARDEAAENMAMNIQRLERMVAAATSEYLDP